MKILHDRKIQVDILNTEIKSKAIDVEQSNTVQDIFYGIFDSIKFHSTSNKQKCLKQNAIK